jgi:predicted ArsR family transcriptional regulator
MIVASVEDYRIAYDLAASVLAETLSDLKRPLRKALDQIRELSKQQDHVSRRQIREAFALPDSTVRRWLRELVELEYVVQLDASRGGQGRVTRYRVVEREGPQEAVAGLVSPRHLRQLLQIGGRA